jgi:hypothetical protein
MGGELPAQTQVEAEIRRLSRRLDQATLKIMHRAMRAARADVAHKRAYAAAIATVQAPNKEQREAAATTATIDSYDAKRMAEAVLLSAQEAARNTRQQLSALQSLAANQRYLIEHSTGVGG